MPPSSSAPPPPPAAVSSQSNLLDFGEDENNEGFDPLLSTTGPQVSAHNDPLGGLLSLDDPAQSTTPITTSSSAPLEPTLTHLINGNPVGGVPVETTPSSFPSVSAIV